MKIALSTKQISFANGVLENFLGIGSIPKEAQSFIKTFVVLSAIGGFVSVLSSTFWILFIIDKIGFSQAGVIISCSLLVQTIFDYPSGSLADWIGQRWVLFSSYLCWATGMFLLIFANSFPVFLLIGAINGLGSAQYSGTLDTWLENNYQKTVQNLDPDRKIYGYSRQRFLTINRVTSALSYIVGGYLASNISREFVFFAQTIAMGFLMLLILALVKNYQEKPESVKVTQTPNLPSQNGYFTYLVNGIKLSISSKAIFCLIMATAFFFAAFTLWGSLLLLPLYFGYTGSDSFAAALRTIIYINAIPISLLAAKFNKRISNNKVSYFTFLLIFGFFPGFFLLTFLIPPENSFNILACLVVIMLMNGLIPTLADLVTVLRQRIMIDLIPAESRNSIYSLQPTITAIIGILLLPIAGNLVQNNGLTAGIAVATIPGIAAVVFTFLMVRYLPKTKQSQK